MKSEAISPPTGADREVRDIEWVRRAQLMYVDGFLVRQSTAPPDSPIPGPNKTSLAHLVDMRCPTDIPAHEQERWKRGFLDADGIATAKGHAYLGTKNPRTPSRPPKAPPVATALEMFPDAVLPKRTPLRMNERGLLSPGGAAPVKRYGTPDDQ
jgi:hypothetical protein